uniref:Uncharacterized protein n=1 Tax=Rhizophora mucronata TaxID=61149 RepID=A0A2P2PDB6_RHIMU
MDTYKEIGIKYPNSIRADRK